MSGDIYQLAYLSQRKQHVTDEDIVDGIVLPALRKNRSLGITGCLWFNPTHFFQILEGPLDNIELIFTAIATDERHHSVDRILTGDTMGVRHFERFGMRAAGSEAARSMPDLIEAYKQHACQPAPKPPRWRDRASRTKPSPAQPGDTGQNFGSLTRTVIDQLADWSDATPA